MLGFRQRTYLYTKRDTHRERERELRSPGKWEVLHLQFKLKLKPY